MQVVPLFLKKSFSEFLQWEFRGGIAPFAMNVKKESLMTDRMFNVLFALTNHRIYDILKTEIISEGEFL